MKRFGLFLLAFLVGFLVVRSVRAETMPANYVESSASFSYDSCQSTSGTTNGACAAIGGEHGTSYRCYPPAGSDPCQMGGVWASACTLGYLNYGTCSTPAHYDCPSTGGWSLDGQTCTRADCAYPTSRGAGGACVNPTCPAAGTAAGPFGGDGNIGMSVNVNGCKIDCDTVLRAAGGWGAAGCKYTGTPADVGSGGDTDADVIPPEQPTTTPQSCMAGGQGYVTNSSGGTSCVPANQMPSSNPITVTNTSNSSTSGPGGSSTSSTSTSQTCAGGNCSVSQTTTNGSGTTTGNWSNVGGFCTDNPNSPLCKAQGDGKTDCDKYPNASGCKELGTPTEETGLDAQSIGVSSITPVTLATNMNCPAPLELPRGLGAFSFTPACDLAGMVRPIVLLFAWIAAGMIVIGAARNG